MIKKVGSIDGSLSLFGFVHIQYNGNDYNI